MPCFLDAAARTSPSATFSRSALASYPVREGLSLSPPNYLKLHGIRSFGGVPSRSPVRDPGAVDYFRSFVLTVVHLGNKV